jgi:AraC family transcriptional activator FtrA
MYPQIRVDPSALYIDEGSIVTSAGSAAGIDVCLHVVRTDYGVNIANRVARTLVSAPHRAGGQAQFIQHSIPTDANDRLTKVLSWARRRVGDRLTVPQLAQRAAMSYRTFIRHFVATIGLTPKEWITHEQLMRAQELLETTALSLDAVAEHSGFASVETFRSSFRRMTRTSPSEYRRSFRLEASINVGH